jgi:hypothetical protein
MAIAKRSLEVAPLEPGFCVRAISYRQDTPTELTRVDGVIWMLTMYPKNVIEKMSAHVLRQIREELENG